MSAVAAGPGRLVRGGRALGRFLPREAWMAVVVVAAASAVFFGLVIHQGLTSDLPLHISLTQNAIRTGQLPPDPLYSVVIALMVGLSTKREALDAAGVLVMGAAMGGKLAVSLGLARRELGWFGGALLVGAIGLCFAFSLPTRTQYLGQLPPNVFHNSTQTLAMPFAVGLFWTSLEFLRSGQARWAWWSAALAVVNVAAKPSVVLPFLPVFALFALWRWGRGGPGQAWRRPELRRAALVLGVAVAALAAQYVYLYEFSTLDEQLYGSNSSHIALAPFDLWRAISPSIPASVLASFLFPLVALLAYGRRLVGSDLVRYAGGLWIAAMAIWILFEETGPRKFHGNFGWPALATTYLLFLAVGIRVLALARGRRPGWREGLAGAAFLAQVVAFVVFVVEWFSTGSYLLPT